MTTILLMITAALGAGGAVFYWCRMRNRIDSQVVADAGHILSEEARPEFNSTPVMVVPDWTIAAAKVQDWERKDIQKEWVPDPGGIVQPLDEADQFDADLMAHLIDHKVA